jgi:hypothetical protein
MQRIRSPFFSVMRFIGVAIFAGIFVISGSLAQEVGSRDVTVSWRVPQDHVASPTPEKCPNLKSTISGDAAKDPADHSSTPSDNGKSLQLTIANIEPVQLRIGEDFTATVLLKNIGNAPILFPWEPDGEHVVRVSPDGTEEKYEVADVNFKLATSADKKGPPIFIQSYGALFAHPDNRSSYIEISPGQWISIKLKGNVDCAFQECPGSIHPSEHAILTALLYQRVLTHSVKECDEDHGSQGIRELNSVPFSVILQEPVDQAPQQPN